MKTEYHFPAGTEFLVDAILAHHGVEAEKVPTDKGLSYHAGGDTLQYSRTIEKEFGFLRLPFDRLTPGGQILLQFRAIGAKGDGYTRYVQVVDGVRSDKPTKGFRHALTKGLKDKGNIQVAAPYDTDPSDFDLATLLEGFIVGALLMKRSDILEVIDAKIAETGAQIDQAKIELLARFTAGSLTKRLHNWQAQKAA